MGRVFGFLAESETPYVVSYNTNGSRQMSLVRKAWRARR
jgi:negative regulator of replication initiation